MPMASGDGAFVADDCMVRQQVTGEVRDCVQE